MIESDGFVGISGLFSTLARPRIPRVITRLWPDRRKKEAAGKESGESL
jgi:hypothetical protein